MIPGVTFSMGGQDWIIPPLTIGQLMTLASEVEQIGTAGAPAQMTRDQLDAAIVIVAAAMSRNYPDLPTQRLRNEMLDTGNLIPITVAVMFGSGLKPAGEAVPADGSAPASVAS